MISPDLRIFMKKGFDIGPVHIDSSVVLGPMAGVTDLPFRILCREMGAGLCYTEMISAKGIYYKNKNTDLLWATSEEDSPLSLQLFGSDPDLMAGVAQQIEHMDFDIFDINMGCPVQKVVKNGEGSALMLDPEKACSIVKKIKSSVKKPVTVKIRKGFDDEHVNAVEFAVACEDAGADAVAVHGRTRQQLYRGEADWNIIKEVKKNVHIPVIASGDIRSYEDAERCFEETGCDAVMIARGAEGNPWIFKEITTGEKILKTPSDISEMVLRHARMLVELKGEYTAIHEMRKHVAWYYQGMRGAAAIRRRASFIDTYDDLENLCRQAGKEIDIKF